MESDVLIVGAGIGGLAAALALSRATRQRASAERQPWSILLLDQAAALAEVGAGLQLGPNASRLLFDWGLGPALERCAVRPEAVQILDAKNGRKLGAMRLGAEFRQRYGADYLTMHRADLHQTLLRALDSWPVQLLASTRVESFSTGLASVKVLAGTGEHFRGRGLLACDGVWSQVREQLLGAAAARATGHLAYRAMLDARDLPAGLLRQVTVWLGPRLHAVAYPVRAGALLNLVVIVEPEAASLASLSVPASERRWDRDAGNDWLRGWQHLHRSLLDLTGAAQSWSVWPLFDRPPLSGPQQMARGRVALLGDAAHPMRPYLAQGAAMAIEDARELAAQVSESPDDLALAFERYAQRRWRRNARVQRTSRRNGVIFHAGTPLRQMRNLAMRLGGERLLDSPWLYGPRIAAA